MEADTNPEIAEHTITSLTPQVMAILFAAGDPVSIRVLAKRLDTKPTQIREVVEGLSETLRPLGLAIARDDNTLQLVTAPEMSIALAEWGKELKESPLSPAAVETMSVIAYLNGATKAEVDFIRGVNSTITLRALSMRGLVASDGEGDTARYRVTIDALKGFGCARLEDLPDWAAINASLTEQLGERTQAVVE